MNNSQSDWLKKTGVKVKSFIPWLKEAALNILIFLKGLFLSILAVILLALAVPSSVVWYLCTIWSKKEKIRDLLTKSGNFFFLVALAIDHLGNVICPGLLTWLFLKDSKTTFPFGVPGESVSEILGWNFAIDNLNERGLNFRYDLNNIDPDHCENAMMSAVYDARHILEKYKLVQAKIDTIEKTKEFMAKY